MPEYRDPFVSNLAALLASNPHADPYGLSTAGREPSRWSGAPLDTSKIKEDDPNRYLLNILMRPEREPGVYDDGVARSNIANMLMELKSRIPESADKAGGSEYTGHPLNVLNWSFPNMLRGSLDNAANTFDRAGGYLDPAGMTAFDVPMMGPGYLAVAAPRNALGAFGGHVPKPKPEPPGFTVYHGSPHDFDRFDIAKVGTGVEDSGFYGHGLYFGAAPATAHRYRNAIVLEKHSDSSRARGTIAEREMHELHGERYGEEPSGEYFLSEQRPHYRYPDGSSLEVDPDGPVRAYGSTTPGYIYEANIRASPERMIDLDKSISAQPEFVRNALMAVARERGLPIGPDMNAFHFYREQLARSLGDPETTGAAAASSALKERGIAGGTGRANREVEHVIYDDKLIEILRKYGLVGALMAGGAYASSDPASATPRNQLLP